MKSLENIRSKASQQGWEVITDENSLIRLVPTVQAKLAIKRDKVIVFSSSTTNRLYSDFSAIGTLNNEEDRFLNWLNSDQPDRVNMFDEYLERVKGVGIIYFQTFLPNGLPVSCQEKEDDFYGEDGTELGLFKQGGYIEYS